jgi:hypothetical protein
MRKQDIKQVLFSCESQAPTALVHPEGLYCDNLDVIEFANKIEHAVVPPAVLAERHACIEFVASLNSFVAEALRDKRGAL